MSLAEDERECYHGIFDKYDVNGDGLSIQEMVKLFRELGYGEDKFSDSDIADIFLDIDTSGDKRISQEEFLKVMDQRPRSELNESNLRKIFDQMDKDGSGKVNAQEFLNCLEAAGCQTTLDAVKDMIKDSDASGDGMIDFAEMCAILNQ